MKSIWKYPLQIKVCNKVQMPVGAEVLHIETQRNEVCMWALVDSDAHLEERRFEVFGTGHELPNRYGKRHHIGTAMTAGGGLVWHVFERA